MVLSEFKIRRFYLYISYECEIVEEEDFVGPKIQSPWLGLSCNHACCIKDGNGTIRSVCFSVRMHWISQKVSWCDVVVLVLNSIFDSRLVLANEAGAVV